jgi:hemerythrin-like domain-containing protein
MAGLRQEHKGLNQLIALLQSKLEELNQGHSPNFNLMEDVINYIENYANAYHHPKEDVIYHYIIEQQLDEKGLFSAIVQEHKKFVQITSHLRQSIQSILMDTIVPRDKFIVQLDEFIREEQSHIENEENIIFPLAESLLTEQDWIVISQSIPDIIEDPLFGRQVKAEYKELYKRLTSDTS